MASRIEKENSLDIELATRTLSYIESILNLNIIPQDLFRKLRALVANLCEFQNRFARPMLLPFQLGNDLVHNLEVHRPINVLLRFKCAFALDPLQHAGTTEFDDCMEANGQRYCLVGGKTWKELVAQGALQGGDAVKPTITAFTWLPYLFNTLAVGARASLEIKSEARKLAACWAHVASQVDYTAKPEDEEEEFDPAPLIESISVSAQKGLEELEKDPSLLDEYDSEDDADFNPDAADDDDDDEDDDDEESEGMVVEPNEEQGEKGEPVDVEDDDDLPPLEDVGIQTIEPERQVSPEKTIIQTIMFDTIKVLQAYMPDPDSDLEWFKRVLKDIKVAQVTNEKEWYPFGCPPMEPLIETLKQDYDPYAKQTASSIILLFQSQMGDKQQQEHQ